MALVAVEVKIMVVVAGVGTLAGSKGDDDRLKQTRSRCTWSAVLYAVVE